MNMSKRPAECSITERETAEKRIRELLAEIDKLCGINKIPYFFAAAIRDDGETTEYIKTARTGLPMGLELSEDFITEYLKVARGCEVVFPEYLADLELPENMLEGFE